MWWLSIYVATLAKQGDAIDEELIELKFSEKSLCNPVGSDAASTLQAAELLTHASTATSRKHYRNVFVKVQPLVRKPDQWYTSEYMGKFIQTAKSGTNASD